MFVPKWGSLIWDTPQAALSPLSGYVEPGPGYRDEKSRLQPQATALTSGQPQASPLALLETFTDPLVELVSEKETVEHLWLVSEFIFRW